MQLAVEVRRAVSPVDELWAIQKLLITRALHHIEPLSKQNVFARNCDLVPEQHIIPLDTPILLWILSFHLRSGR